MLIRSASFKRLWAIIFSLDPFLSPRRETPNWTYLVATSTGMLITLPSVHVNVSSSGRVGLVPGTYIVCGEESRNSCLTNYSSYSRYVIVCCYEVMWYYYDVFKVRGY